MASPNGCHRLELARVDGSALGLVPRVGFVLQYELQPLVEGAAILGIEGDEAVHAIADVMYAKAPYTVISRAVHAHPTVSELIPTTLQSLAPL